MSKSPVRDETVPLMKEELSVSKRDVAIGRVRITTKTETSEEMAEATLDRDAVEVTRVPINQPVDATPPVRTDGDTTIFPVMEERLVVIKQLVLVEELHVRQRVEHEVVRTPVRLRRQHAMIEHVDPDGSP